MVKILPLIFLLASQLFISGVLSTSTLTIENKCDQTVWPVIYSWNSKITTNTTGFALQKGEARKIRAPTSWFGIISGRTLCSTATGNFSCVTGDCESGQIECPLSDYSWVPVTYAYFKLDNGGLDSYSITVEYGYNLPIVVVPSNRTCVSAGCVVDNLNKTCPQDLKLFSKEKVVSCSSSCQEFDTPEVCCTNNYQSKETCKPTLYTTNFESACPRAYAYAYHDHDTTFTCPNSTDYVITFCPSSFFPNNAIRRSNTRSSMAPTPLAEKKHDSQWKSKTIIGTPFIVATTLLLTDVHK